MSEPPEPPEPPACSQCSARISDGDCVDCPRCDVLLCATCVTEYVQTPSCYLPPDPLAQRPLPRIIIAAACNHVLDHEMAHASILRCFAKNCRAMSCYMKAVVHAAAVRQEYVDSTRTQDQRMLCRAL
eukprot:6212868-Pleurochrysis_carterae.AAC.1